MNKPGGGKDLQSALDTTGKVTLSAMAGAAGSGPALKVIEKVAKVAGPMIMTKMAHNPEKVIWVKNAAIGFLEGLLGPGSIPGVPKGANPVVNEGIRKGARKVGKIIRDNYVQ